jgi:hypothetical protein
MIKRTLIALFSVCLLLLGGYYTFLVSWGDGGLSDYLHYITLAFLCMGLAGLWISTKGSEQQQGGGIDPINMKPRKMSLGSKIFFILILLALIWGIWGVSTAMYR